MTLTQLEKMDVYWLEERGAGSQGDLWVLLTKWTRQREKVFAIGLNATTRRRDDG